MPELPRKPGLPLEEKAQIDPAAEAPTPRAPHPSSGETDPQGEAAPPAMPAPAASLSPTADEQLPIPPAGDDATPMAEVEEPTPAPLPDAGEAAAIGAMSAAEAAVRQRAEADYQRAVDDAIRAAQWRTDDAVYVGLVDELVRLRGPGGVESGSLSSAARAAGGDDAPWGAPRMAPGAGAWGGDGGAAYGTFGEADASGGGPRLRPAVYGSDDERVRAEQVQGRAGGGNRIRGPAGTFADAGAPIREFFFRQNMDAIRRLEPKNPALSYIRDPNVPISREGLRASGKELEAALARVTDRIAGHALKRAAEFGNADRAGLAAIARNVITNPASQRRDLQDGRTAFYDKRTNTLVIVNPYARDQGTMMKPRDKQAYVDGLR